MPLVIKKGRISGRRNGPYRCSAVIAAAGTSSRMDGEDKLFSELCGAPVLAHTLRAFELAECIDEIIVVTRADCLETVSDICQNYGFSKVSAIIAGGEDRAASVLNGALAVSKKCNLIAVHDGARSCIDGGTIKRTVEAAAKYIAAAPGIPVTSTLKRSEGGFITGTVDRSSLFEIQTPQVFDADLLKAALTNAKNNAMAITDDCMAVEILGMRIYITEGSRENIKLTMPGDMIIAEAIMRRREQKTCGSDTDMTRTG